MCLNSLLLSYNLSSSVNFLTRIQNIAISAIDNIFIDSSKLETYILTPLSKGLPNHEAQLLEILYFDSVSHYKSCRQLCLVLR